MFVKRQFIDGIEILLGTQGEFGSFLEADSRFETQHRRIREELTTDPLCWPSVGLTNRVAVEPHMVELLDPEIARPLFEKKPGFFRTWDGSKGTAASDKTDAVILPLGKYATGLSNADCPMLVGITKSKEPRDQYMIMAHLGLGCLISKTCRTSVIQELFKCLKALGIFPSMVHLWLGFGATAATYGLSWSDDRWVDIEKQLIEKIAVEFGPRAGKRAVNLAMIALGQIFKAGVPWDNVTIDDYDTVLGCTRKEFEKADAVEKDRILDTLGSKHYSYLMGHKGRNLCMVHQVKK